MKLSKIVFLITGLCFLNSESFTQVQQEWLTRTDSVSAVDIAVDKLGNVYVTGSIYRGTSGFNICLTKYDPDGNQQWMSEYNGIGDDLDGPTAIALDTSGNIFVTGYSFRGPALLNYEIVTIKYNPGGDSLWVRRYNSAGTRDDRGFALAVDSAGNAYVGGYINNTSLGNVYGEDYITLKYSPNGTQLWAAQFDLVWGSVTALAVNPNGNVCVTGVGFESGSTSSKYITINYSSNGNSIWVNRYDGPGNESDVAKAIAIDDSGYVYITGESVGSNGYYDYATVRYSDAGAEQWVRRYNGPVNEDDKAIGIVVDKNQNVYVTGEASVVSGSFVKDFATVKYNKDGDSVWVKLYNGPGNSLDIPVDIAIDSIGSIYITGSSIGADFSGYPDYATIKYNSNGDSLWVQRYNAANLEDVPRAVAVDNSGNLYVTGTSWDNYNYGGSVTIKYSQPLTPFAVNTALPALGTGSTTFFGNTLLTFIGDVTISDSVTIYYYLNPAVPGELPSGIIWIGEYYWRVVNGGLVFTNGYMRLSAEDLVGVTVGGCGACLVWLKRSNSGEPWQNIGGIFEGTFESGFLTSNIPFDSFSEFAIGSTEDPTVLILENSEPNTFALVHNYPNPFNPTTTIRYQLPERSPVSLKVYNTLGREVLTLVNEVQSAGVHSVIFDAKNDKQSYSLASGVYFYRLQAGSFVQTQKMILLK